MQKLFKHQEEGITWLKKRKKALLADDMGIGKTRQAIIATGESTDKGSNNILVICPASMKITWEREIHEVYPGDEVEIIGETNPRKPVWYVVNYDQLKKHELYIIGLKPKSVILDEAHYIKGSSIRAKFSIKICEEAERVYLLTGTPIMNRPIELYNLLRAMSHSLVDSGWISYIIRYCNAFQRTNKYSGRTFWDTSGASNIPELRENIKDIFLRREKKDVLDLPEKLISNVIVELGKSKEKGEDGKPINWKRNYEKAWDDYMEFLKQDPPENLDNIIQARHLVELQKLKQVCSLAKIEQIVEDVESIMDSGEKVIIFTQYTKTLEAFKTRLRKFGTATLAGETSQENRQKAVDAFQTDPRIKIFIGNIKAAGVGITLTAATKVIFADMEWTPALHAQAMDRAHRIGQNQTLNVYFYIAKDTLEEDIVELLKAKEALIQSLMSGDSTKRTKDHGVAHELLIRHKKHV